MSYLMPVRPCRACGEPKRIDTWCASPECAERVAAEMEKLNSFVRRSVAESVRGGQE